MEIGIVKFFDSRKRMRYGFISVAGSGDVFFHFKDGENIKASHNGPRFCAGKLIREPKKGDILVFERQIDSTGPKAVPWGYGEDFRRAEKESNTHQTVGQMTDAIRSARPGHRLKLVFADKTFDGDLTGRLRFILGLHHKSIEFDDVGVLTLKTVVESGKWERCWIYTITVLKGFNPEHFIRHTVERELFESINRIK